MRRRRWWVVLNVIAAWALCGGTAAAQTADRQPPPPSPTQALKQLSIEELAELRVTSAGKRVERLSDVAAAVTVIRGEDIRRLGLTSLPEALRLADGMEVAQVYGPGWAISTRGFTISTANKLLVLVDGRTVYSPLFSGVFWDVLDVVMADIDRIEIVRGPGGALWGANAVNGVVNIITKTAIETQGGYATVTAGNEIRAIATVRYGGRLSPGIAYRAYAKFRADDQHVFATGAPGLDQTSFGQTGFRLDSDSRQPTFWSVQGDVYLGSEALFDRGATTVSGGNVLGRWTKRWSPTSQFQAQVFYDRTNRQVDRQYDAGRNTVDIDVQQQLQAGTRHKLVFGAGVRAWRGHDLGEGPGFYFDPQTRTTTLANLFASDDVALTTKLSAVIGAKLEHDSYSGAEVEPSLRLRFSPDARQTLWAAVSRAVRMPTRFDTDLRVLLPNGQLIISGDPDFKSENVLAYEGGYRTRPSEWLSIDVATFFNRYGNLRSQEPPAAAGLPFQLSNGLNARTSGIETSATVSPAPWWQAHVSYSHLWERFGRSSESRDASNGVNEANDPANVFSLRSAFDLPRQIQIDAMFRHLSSLPQPAVAAYSELSGRVGWTPVPRLELALIGQNLLHPRHEEFAAGTPREFFERSVSFKCSVRF